MGLLAAGQELGKALQDHISIHSALGLALQQVGLEAVAELVQ